MASPMLISVISSGLGRRSGQITRRSETMPTIVTNSTATRQASATLLIVANKRAAIMPPITTHSPWAKFIAPVLLNTTLKPSAMRA